MGISEREARYRFCVMNSVGPASFKKLKERCRSAAAAWEEKAPDLKEKQLIEWRFFHTASKEEELKREYDRVIRSSTYRFIIPGDPGYPESLEQIPDPPAGLFIRGAFPERPLPMAAIVGSRACTDYGRHQAVTIAEALAQAGVGIVSGLAAGIDAYGHRGALSGGGYTVAVLGNGVDRCYPMLNINLYNTLVEKGTVISEYAPGTPGRPMNFPMRNRLISGLSQIVVVIEAKKKSGSLITVERALEQGKDVMAVPGRVGDPLSEGCNHLIRQGAGIVTAPEDILFAMGIQTEIRKKKTGSSVKLSPEEASVLQLIGTDPVHPDQLCKSLDMPPGSLYMILFRLENAGLVRNAGPGLYARA